MFFIIPIPTIFTTSLFIFFTLLLYFFDTLIISGTMASDWFYAMAGGSVLGLIILFILQPVDFNTILIKRLKDKGINFQVEDRITECSDTSDIPKKNLPENNVPKKNIPEKFVLAKEDSFALNISRDEIIANLEDNVIDEIPEQLITREQSIIRVL